MIRFVNWVLSLLFPYKPPSRLGTMLVCQNTVTDKVGSAWDDFK